MEDGAENLLQVARDTARSSGAVLVEYLRCDQCKDESWVVHSFAESFPCPSCGQRTASTVRRPPRDGEVTKEILDTAIAAIYRSIPEPEGEVVAALHRASPKVRTLIRAVAAREVRQAVNDIYKLARDIAAHTGPNDDPIN